MPKKRSKIIKDLIMNNIDVLQAIQSLNFMLEDLKDEKIKNWVDKEMNGYDKDDDIPKYRMANAVVVGDIQIGYNIIKNVNIPFTSKDAFKIFNTYEINEPISVVLQYSIAEKESETHGLVLDANTSIVNTYQASNGTVINAQRHLSIYSYTNVLSIIKDKLLNIFKILEENYGNLDELYIDFSDNKKEKEIIKEIQNVIYVDKSINIGENNEIKNSNIGENNEN